MERPDPFLGLKRRLWNSLDVELLIKVILEV
jgi:hypothetical protein